MDIFLLTVDGFLEKPEIVKSLMLRALFQCSLILLTACFQQQERNTTQRKTEGDPGNQHP